MPVYEYECINNGHTFEVIQNMSAEPVKRCKFCDSDVKRLVSAFKIRDKFAGMWVFDRTTGKDILRDK